jgi:uncharacterized membrane protein required for colicin V production
MTVYDGVMAMIVLYTVVHGYFRGAAWQIAPILSLVLGYMVAMPMSVTMAQYFGPPPLNRLFALVSIYILVSITVYLLVRSFRDGVDKAKLTEVDRHLGAIMGGVKGVLVTLVATCMLIIYFPQMRDVILKSESSTIAAKMISQIYPLLPKAMHTILNPYLQKLDEQLPIEYNANDGFQSGANPVPRSNRMPAIPATRDDSPLFLTPTNTAPEYTPSRAPEYAPPTAPVTRQPLGFPDEPPLDFTDERSLPKSEPLQQPQPQPRRRPVVRAAQVPEDDPFEAADPDRALSPPR